MVYYIQNIKPNLNRVPKKKRFGFIKSRFYEFCKRTDLHGLKYIVMEELNSFERGCWAVAVICSIICAAFFVVAAYRWYARNPIVTVIESTQGAIWDVPFPAVTICELNIVSRKAAMSLAKNLTLPANVTDEFVFKTLRYIPLLHSSSITSSEIKQDLRLLQDILDLNNISTETLFRMLSPTTSCNNLVQRCMWKNTFYRCEQLFQQVYLTMSLCCTFNYFAVLPNRKQQSSLILMPKPRRVASCGYQTALTVLVGSDLEDYYSTNVISNGVMVLIDNAYNVPDLDSAIRLMNPSTEVLVALAPEHTYTTPGIKTFKPEERQCYYHNEIKIGDFLQYSFHNCKAYQRIQIIKKACNCIPFYFPLRSKDLGHICDFRDLECLENLIVPSDDMKIREELLKDTVECLPECEHFDYPVEVALGKLAVDVPLNGLPFYQKMNLGNRSILNVFFNDLVSTRYRRDVYLNWQNILASFGGLLSLMLGFTLISAMDFILFFIFNVFYNLTHQPDKNGKSTKGTIVHVQEIHKRLKENKSFKDFNESVLYVQRQRKY